MDKKAWMQAAMAAIITAGLNAQAAYAIEQASDKPGFEKCYGIAKKGRNDCTAHQHGCGGGAVKDSDPAEWIYLPSGTCNKIVGGNLQAPSDKTKS